MTEYRTSRTMPMQMGLFGGTEPPQGLTPHEKVAFILETNPEARDDDRELMLAYWQQFDALALVLGAEAMGKFAAWFRKSTHPETIRRRRAEIQKLSGGGGSMLPSPGEADRRRALDGAGPPRGRR